MLFNEVFLQKIFQRCFFRRYGFGRPSCILDRCSGFFRVDFDWWDNRTFDFGGVFINVSLDFERYFGLHCVEFALDGNWSFDWMWRFRYRFWSWFRLQQQLSCRRRFRFWRRRHSLCRILIRLREGLVRSPPFLNSRISTVTLTTIVHFQNVTFVFAVGVLNK